MGSGTNLQFCLPPIGFDRGILLAPEKVGEDDRHAGETAQLVDHVECPARARGVSPAGYVVAPHDEAPGLRVAGLRGNVDGQVADGAELALGSVAVFQRRESSVRLHRLRGLRCRRQEEQSEDASWAAHIEVPSTTQIKCCFLDKKWHFGPKILAYHHEQITVIYLITYYVAIYEARRVGAFVNKMQTSS